MNRKLNITIEDNKYELEFPTVGQYIDIETEKQRLARGQFNSLITSGTVSSLRGANIVNCIATINILCPSIIKDLKPGLKSLIDLDMLDFAKLMKVYLDQILPWYSGWFEEFGKVLQNDSEENK